MDSEPRIPEENVQITTTMIEGKNGEPFTVDFFHFPNTLAQATEDPRVAAMVPKVVEVATASFPHWGNDTFFADRTLPTAKDLSVVKDKSGEIVGFNRYTIGEVEMPGGESAKYMYANYAGVHPNSRQNGLMERSRAADVKKVAPDVLSGCSAVGEIHMGVLQLSQETGRVMYPTEDTVPQAIGELGRSVYAAVNGEAAGPSVDTDTLVRHGKSPYGRGRAEYAPLNKLGPNDAIVYLSVAKGLNDRLVNPSPVTSQS